MSQSLQWHTSKLFLCDDLEVGQARAARLANRTLDNDPYILVIRPDESSLKIEQIRELQTELGTNPPPGVTRLVFLGPAHKITDSAQQALLKLLEEPPAQTEISLFARSESDVLETIRSRCVIVDLRQPEDSARSKSAFLVPLSQAKNLQEKVLLLGQVPTQREEAKSFILEELRACQNEPPSQQLTQLQTTALNVLEALSSNVTPALCVDQFLME